MSAVYQQQQQQQARPQPRPSVIDPLGDRRRGTREPVSAKGLVSLDGGRSGDECEGQLVEVADLSLYGVGFRSPVAFVEGAMHQILVMAGPLRMSSRIKIASARQGADGWFEVGAAFC
jgi:hypothetical protein